jgi:hypothetical protein
MSERELRHEYPYPSGVFMCGYLNVTQITLYLDDIRLIHTHVWVHTHTHTHTHVHIIRYILHIVYMTQMYTHALMCIHTHTCSAG